MSSSMPENGPFWARWWTQIFNATEASVRESIEDVLEDNAVDDEDGFSREELHMLRNLLGFRDVRIEDVMVPRADIEAVEADMEAQNVLARFADCGHSRMPIFRDTLDQPLGMVHVKDFMSNLQEKSEIAAVDVLGLVRPVIYVPPSMPALDLLLKMQATRSHMALVIDEYGGTDGLVTIEDLIEEIVGEIEDEHDEDEAGLLRQESAGRWRAQARLLLPDLEEALQLPFSEDEDFEDIDTLGGLVFAIAGRVPERGEMISYTFEDQREVEFVIRDGDPRRIKTVDIKHDGKRDA
jgi:magnesium and cobalt transporter